MTYHGKYLACNVQFECIAAVVSFVRVTCGIYRHIKTVLCTSIIQFCFGVGYLTSAGTKTLSKTFGYKNHYCNKIDYLNDYILILYYQIKILKKIYDKLSILWSYFFSLSLFFQQVDFFSRLI